MTLKAEDLHQFTGSESWYRHGINRKMLYTDGVKYVADVGGAYWLLDEIAITNLLESSVRAEEFQVWTLQRNTGSSGAFLTCEDGNDNPVFSSPISFTDFPLDSITIWVENNTMMLPSER